MCTFRSNIFFFKQKTAYEISACLVGSKQFVQEALRAEDHVAAMA